MGLASLPGRKAAPAVSVAEKKAAPVQPITTPTVQPSRVSPKINATAEPPPIFNFPPGTKFTPVEPSPLEKPLELLVAEKLAQARSAAAKTNAVAKTATNIAASASLTNAAKPVVIAAPAATNATQPKFTPANAVALSTTNQPATNGIAFAATKPPTTGPDKSAPGNTTVARPSGLGVEWTVQRTFYVAGVTGASCFLVGLFLLYRKFRRPTQSIISRSLLQR
jgi:hypothetical protein